jgi:hypothetical protein
VNFILLFVCSVELFTWQVFFYFVPFPWHNFSQSLVFIPRWPSYCCNCPSLLLNTDWVVGSFAFFSRGPRFESVHRHDYFIPQPFQFIIHIPVINNYTSFDQLHGAESSLRSWQVLMCSRNSMHRMTLVCSLLCSQEPAMIPFLRHMDPVHITYYFCMIPFYITLLSGLFP